jgi:hypothetical protein
MRYILVVTGLERKRKERVMIQAATRHYSISSGGMARPICRSMLFPEAVIACLVEGRAPCREELEGIAARIWRDVRSPGDADWSSILPGSAIHRRMIAAARAAEGLHHLRSVVDPCTEAGMIPLAGTIHR